MDYQSKKKAGWFFLFLLSFVFYTINVSNEFIWDDQYFIALNNFLTDCKNIPRYFQLNPFILDPLPMLSRPLTAVSLALNMCFLPNPLFFKFFNIFIHSLNGILLFLCLLSFGRRPGISFLLSLLFLFSPVSLDLVNISTFRNHLFSCFFLLSFLLLTLRTNNLSPWLIPLYILALASGETAFFLFLPAIMALKLLKGKNFRFSQTIFILLLIISAIFLVYRIPRGHYESNSTLEFLSTKTVYSAKGIHIDKRHSSHEKTPGRSAFYSFASSAKIFGNYLSFLFIPVGEFNQEPEPVKKLPEAFFSLFLIFSFSAASLWLLRRKELLGFSMLMFLLSLSIYMNVLFAVENSQANRYLYIPIVFATFAFYSIYEKFKFSIWLFAALAGFNFLAVYYSAPIYHNNFSFFSYLESYGPNDAKTSSALYYEYLRMRNYSKALEEVYKLGGMRIKNREQNILFLEILVYIAWNKPEKALERVEKLSSLNFDKGIIYNLKALVETRTGHSEKAKKLLQKSLKLNPALKESKILSVLLEEGTLFVSPQDGLSLNIINFYSIMGVKPSIKIQIQK